MSISREIRDELRSLAVEATPGPWIPDHAQGGPGDAEYVAQAATGDLICEPCRAADRFYVAACDPQTITALLDALDDAEGAS